jgi:phenylpropionate dioxygenase-like ring-hydroxylating dioxygenase large terminal subunit
MFLEKLWYFALPGPALKRGAMLAKTLLGKPILLARGTDGAPFALHDICPHRGIPLSKGRFDGHEVECFYHGWRFGGDGRCTAIPSLIEGQKFNVERVQVRRYPCREVQGNIWVYFGDEGDTPGDPPHLPGIGERRPALIETTRFPGHVDHAVVGLMDPAHGPFVHRSWWWRSRRSIHEKSKSFAPSLRGFTMVRHPPSSNSAAYKLLGGSITTEISFQLPGIRIEHIRAGRHSIIGLTAVTPITQTQTEVTQVFYWTQPWLTPLKPVARHFVRAFLKQDRDVVVMQQEGLAHNPQLMLINDADMQAKWYYRLKDEWNRSLAEGRPFRNPVQAQVLRWRS